MSHHLTTMNPAELQAAITDDTLLDRAYAEVHETGDVSEETLRAVQREAEMRRKPATNRWPGMFWAHGDPGVAAFLVTQGRPVLYVDLQDERPLFVFDHAADDSDAEFENLVIAYMMEAHRARPWTLACAHRQLDRLVAMGREAGGPWFDVPAGWLWEWIPGAEERAAV